MTLHKGDTTLTTQALKTKLNNLWPQLQNWSLIPLGKGFFELNFNSIEDMKQIWAIGVVNLKPGFMRFYRWTKDFTPKAQAQTHAQVWVRLMQLPQEYWGRQTLFEIASGLGTPLTIDEVTQTRRFGLFARVLIDVDMSENMFESVIVERDGNALPVMVQYEKYPLFCSHCKTIGHSIHACSKINAATNVQVTKRVNNVNQRAQSKADLANKKSAKFPVNTIDAITVNAQVHPHIAAIGNKSAKVSSHDDIQEGPFCFT